MLKKGFYTRYSFRARTSTSELSYIESKTNYIAEIALNSNECKYKQYYFTGAVVDQNPENVDVNLYY